MSSRYIKAKKTLVQEHTDENTATNRRHINEVQKDIHFSFKISPYFDTWRFLSEPRLCFVHWAFSVLFFLFHFSSTPSFYILWICVYIVIWIKQSFHGKYCISSFSDSALIWSGITNFEPISVHVFIHQHCKHFIWTFNGQKKTNGRDGLRFSLM